jgi:L-threonylcarbamoyladenylate synthase
MTINPLSLLDRDGIEVHLRAGGAALLPTDTLPAWAAMP